MDSMVGISRRIVKVGDDDLFEIAYSDYLHSRSFVDNLKETKALLFANEVMEKSKKFWARLTQKQKVCVELAVIVPATFIGISAGHFIPDLDIRLLGLGWHRYFLSHSAIGAYLGKRFYESYRDISGGKQDKNINKIVGTFVAAGAFGLGVHLLADGSLGLLDGEKAVVWGIPGIGKVDTLIEGTMIDDNLYLLGNSMWAFKIAKDIIVVTYAKELELAKKFVSKYLPRDTIHLLAKRWGEESMERGNTASR